MIAVKIIAVSSNSEIKNTIVQLSSYKDGVSLIDLLEEFIIAQRQIDNGQAKLIENLDDYLTDPVDVRKCQNQKDGAS